MTTPSPSADALPASAPSPTPVVTPEPESRLDQLTARYETAKALAKQASDEFEDLKTSLKAELASRHPEQKRVVLSSPHLLTPLELKAVPSWRFDSKRCKAERPDIYAAFAKQSTSWRLEAV